MPSLINAALQSHQRGARVWLEGQKILREGFEPGTRYDIQEEPQCLILTIAVAGRFTVSRRRKGEKETPIIDITSQKLEVIFKGIERLRIVVKDGCIVIRPHHLCLARKERNSRLIHKMQSQLPLDIGSLFHGGGVLDKAVHHGIAKSGLSSRLGVAVEIESRYLNASLANNSELWDSGSLAINSGVQFLNMSGSFPLDGVCAGIPCKGASPSGRSKLKLTFAEDHESVGACFYWFLNFIQFVNPAFFVIENVPAFSSTASASVIRSVLNTLGYQQQERIFGGNEFAALEDRQRWVLVGISEGLHKGFELETIRSKEEKPASLGSVLDPVPLDSEMWKEYEYLSTKEERDLAAGKGFRRQLLSESDEKCGCLGAQYNKARSTEPFLRHPEKPHLSRLFTPREHARLKGVPEDVIDGLSTTVAHEVLGQSVIYSVFVEIATAIGNHFLSLLSEDVTINNSLRN